MLKYTMIICFVRPISRSSLLKYYVLVGTKFATEKKNQFRQLHNRQDKSIFIDVFLAFLLF